MSVLAIRRSAAWGRTGLAARRRGCPWPGRESRARSRAGRDPPRGREIRGAVVDRAAEARDAERDADTEEGERGFEQHDVAELHRRDDEDRGDASGEQRTEDEVAAAEIGRA